MKVKDLLNSEDKWCKYNYAKDQYGNPIGSSDEDAVCFCLSGGISRCYFEYGNGYHHKIYDKLKETIKELYPHYSITGDVVVFNDNPNTKFEDIQKVLQAADV